jgi:hypothetical protein
MIGDESEKVTLRYRLCHQVAVLATSHCGGSLAYLLIWAGFWSGKRGSSRLGARCPCVWLHAVNATGPLTNPRALL